MLSRNTTLTLSRDSFGGNGLTFAPVVFHDGQGLMVKKNSGIESIQELANKSICVGSGTTTEQNINDTFESLSLPYEPCLLYTSPSPRDLTASRMPSSA